MHSIENSLNTASSLFCYREYQHSQNNYFYFSLFKKFLHITELELVMCLNCILFYANVIFESFSNNIKLSLQL